MQPQEPSRAHLGVVVRAAAYAVDPTGKAAPLLVFSEHNSTVVFRPPLRLFDNASAGGALSIVDVPINWDRSSPYYRRVPSINTTYQGHPFARFGTGNLTLRAKVSNNANAAPGVFARGLGFWAPMHAEYNLTTLSAQGLSRFVGWVGMVSLGPDPRIVLGKWWNRACVGRRISSASATASPQRRGCATTSRSSPPR